MIPATDWIAPLVPLLITLSFVFVGLWSLAHWQRKHAVANRDQRLPRHLLTIAAYLFASFLVMLSLPVSDSIRSQILSLGGLIVTALIALSSTSLVANAMAGLLLRLVNSFHPGDFIHVGENFGRVTERGLFHTEIQTEDRDLMTLPNLHLINNPVTVIRDSGTIISATLTLGYDVHHLRIEELLKQAATSAGLKDPFVHVRELGNFSVVYRVCGRLEEINSLLTARSNLRREMLDVLHGAKVEIVSPSFMNQRPQKPDKPCIPEPWQPVIARVDAPNAEEIVFDKAEQVIQRNDQLQHISDLRRALNELKSEKDEANLSAIEKLESEIEALEARADEEDQIEVPPPATQKTT